MRTGGARGRACHKAASHGRSHQSAGCCSLLSSCFRSVPEQGLILLVCGARPPPIKHAPVSRPLPLPLASDARAATAGGCFPRVVQQRLTQHALLVGHSIQLCLGTPPPPVPPRAPGWRGGAAACVARRSGSRRAIHARAAARASAARTGLARAKPHCSCRARAPLSARPLSSRLRRARAPGWRAGSAARVARVPPHCPCQRFRSTARAIPQRVPAHPPLALELRRLRRPPPPSSTAP